MTKKFASEVLLVLYLISKVQCYFSVEPQPKIALMGEAVTFKCAVNSFVDVVSWSYAPTNQHHIISTGSQIIRKEYKHVYSVIKERHSSSQIFYNLFISKCYLNTSGEYKCIINKRVSVTTLTVLNQTICYNTLFNNRIFVCAFSFAGAYNFSTKWNCQGAEGKAEVSYRQSNNTDDIIKTYISSHMTILKTIKASNDYSCNFTILSSNKIQTKFQSFQSNHDISNTELDKPFELIIHPVTHPTIDVLNFNTIHQDRAVKCNAESNLYVTFNFNYTKFMKPMSPPPSEPHVDNLDFLFKPLRILFKSFSRYAYTYDSKLKNYGIITFDKSGVYTLMCSATNGLNHHQVILVVTNITVVDTINQKECEQDKINECLKNVSEFVFAKKLPTSTEEQQMYCSENRKLLPCIHKYNSCPLPRKMSGLLKAVLFYCNGDYGRMTYMPYTMEESYPHVLFNKYVQHQGMTEKSELEMKDPSEIDIDDDIRIHYCDRIKKTAYILSQEMYAGLTGKDENSAEWVRKFYEALLGFKLSSVPFSFYSEFTNQTIKTKNCTDHESCVLFNRCAHVHTEMLKLFNFGFTLVPIKEKFLKETCEMSFKDFEECNHYLLSSCSNFVQTLTNPFSFFRSYLCNMENSKFFSYTTCYGKLKERIDVGSEMLLFQCSSIMRRRLEEMEEEVDRHPKTCLIAKEFLDCIETSTRLICPEPLAGRFQRSLVRHAIYKGLKQLDCRLAFLHSENEVRMLATKLTPPLACQSLIFFIVLFLFL